MLEKIQAFGETKKQLEKELVLFLKQKTIPVSIRWEVYKSAVENKVITQYDSWVQHFPIIEEELGLEWYDDFYIDRYQKANYVKIIKHIEELDVEVTDDQLTALKEQFMATGKAGFNYDW